MSISSSDRPAAFRIGRVFGDTFAVLGRNLVLCIGLAAIFSGIPTFLYQLWLLGTVQSVMTDAQVGVPPAFNASSIALGVGAYLIYMVLASIVQAALVRATIEDLNGQKPTFSDSLSRAFAVLLPIIGLSILVYLGMMIGFMLLIIPGIYLLIRWSAALPVLVQERRGVLESMSRSSELTSGSRWRILGLFIILIIAIVVLQMIFEALTGVIVPLAGLIVATAVVSLLSSVTSLIFSIAMAVSYVELRYVKEGTDVNDLAEIFA